MLEIRTERLRLMTLTAAQLAALLEDIEALEAELGFPIAREQLTEPVARAIGMKRVKLAEAPLADQPWLSYWLMQIPAVPVGAGLIGFKSLPTEKGEVVVGYGIDPAYQRQGYTAEALRALVSWAFERPACRVVVADIDSANRASQRVAEKAGLSLRRVSGQTLYYEARREG